MLKSYQTWKVKDAFRTIVSRAMDIKTKNMRLNAEKKELYLHYLGRKKVPVGPLAKYLGDIHLNVKKQVLLFQDAIEGLREGRSFMERVTEFYGDEYGSWDSYIRYVKAVSLDMEREMRKLVKILKEEKKVFGKKSEINDYQEFIKVFEKERLIYKEIAARLKGYNRGFEAITRRIMKEKHGAGRGLIRGEGDKLAVLVLLMVPIFAAAYMMDFTSAFNENLLKLVIGAGSSVVLVMFYFIAKIKASKYLFGMAHRYRKMDKLLEIKPIAS